MKIILTGTGTSQGVPVIACQCRVCKSDDPRDKRFRTAAYFEVDGINIAIDAGPDFRMQMLENNITKLDAVLLTHSHKDHIAGMDDLRTFNFLQGKAMPVYGDEATLKVVRKEFSYAFGSNKYPGTPSYKLHKISGEPFNIGHVKIIPLRVWHGNLPVLGYRIGQFTYLTDVNRIESNEMELIKDSEIMVITGLRKEEHYSHFNIYEASDIIRKSKAKTGYLTHISHLLGPHSEVEPELQDNIFLAYDGLTLITN